jgi:hypothetical protein
MNHRTVFRVLTLVFILALGLIVTWANRGDMPRLIALLYAFPAGDKIGHDNPKS